MESEAFAFGLILGIWDLRLQMPDLLIRTRGIYGKFRVFKPGVLDQAVRGCPPQQCRVRKVKNKDNGSAVPGSTAHTVGIAGTDTNVGSLIRQFNQGVAVPIGNVGHGPTGLRGSWGQRNL